MSQVIQLIDGRAGILQPGGGRPGAELPMAALPYFSVLPLSPQQPPGWAPCCPPAHSGAVKSLLLETHVVAPSSSQMKLRILPLQMLGKLGLFVGCRRGPQDLLSGKELQGLSAVSRLSLSVEKCSPPQPTHTPPHTYLNSQTRTFRCVYIDKPTASLEGARQLGESVCSLDVFHRASFYTY